MSYSFAARTDGISGSAIREILKLMVDPAIISFAGGNPSADSFPAEELAALSCSLLQAEGSRILQYGTTEGWAPLRESICKVVEPRQMRISPEEVLILTGSSQGIELFTKISINPGDVILCETPTFLGALQTFATYQAKVVGIPMEEDGMDVAALERAIVQYRPKFIYTIPTFQNPTGITMSLAKRQQLAALAAQTDTMILEDDPYGSLRYAGEDLPSIYSLDPSGHVIHLLSFSKTVSPGLRVGAAIGNPEILRKMTVNKQGMDTHTSNLSQALIDAFIRRDRYFPHIAEIIPAYRDKLHTMLDGFVHFPQGTVHTTPQGGLFVWCELPGSLSATDLMQTAVDHKVAYVPGTHFYPEGGHDNTFRLNFSMCSVEQIASGMRTLGQVFVQAQAKS